MDFLVAPISVCVIIAIMEQTPNNTVQPEEKPVVRALVIRLPDEVHAGLHLLSGHTRRSINWNVVQILSAELRRRGLLK